MIFWFWEAMASILCLTGNLLLWAANWKIGLGYCFATIAMAIWTMNRKK